MLTALVARPPVFGGKAKSFNAEKAKAIPGVKAVVEIESGIAVIADGFWPAQKGREALEIVWDEGPLAKLDSRHQRHSTQLLGKQSGVVAFQRGDVEQATERVLKRLKPSMKDLTWPMPPWNPSTAW